MKKNQLFKQYWLLAALLLPSLSFSQVNEEWVRRYTGDFNAEDRANALAVDKHGNVYVTGRSAGTGQGQNFATIKYDSEGRIKWNKRYTGPGDGFDEATAIAVDHFGHIYVAGSSAGAGTQEDYTVIQYDDDGDTRWVRRYNGPGNGLDRPAAIAVDHFGNVYITGLSVGSGNTTDYATLKYNRRGILQWVARYDNGGWDDAQDIAVDAEGNVYVTGGSIGNSTGYDYATIKYNKNGVQQWVKRYDAASLRDFALALAVDHKGNVYVTGGSSPGADSEGLHFSDYATIKYDRHGNTIWVQRYDREGFDVAMDLVMDEAANLYITGSSGPIVEDPDNDYATVKYNAAGVQQWVAIYDGPESANGGGAVALALDPRGNVYVTGRTEVISLVSRDYVTVKYNNNGAEQWVRRYDGPGNVQDYATDLAVDKAGNVYVTGGSRITPIASHDDFATIKYDTNGDTKWARRYNSPSREDAGLPDRAVALAANNGGKIYVTGSSTRNRTGQDYTTISYNKEGGRRWIRHYNGAGNGNDHAQALATDGNGNVYVTGWSRGRETCLDYVTIKYNDDGHMKWVKGYNSPGNDVDEATAIAVDRKGNVYVTGRSVGSGTGYDYATIRYDKHGNTMWVRRYNGPGNGTDEASALAVDASGNIYITGHSAGSGIGTDYATIKYNRDGVQQWVARYDGGSYEEARALAVDAAGNVYVTGNNATVKYNSNGIQQWVAIYGNIGAEIARAIAVDPSGNVYVTGDVATIKYDNTGLQQWAATFPDGGEARDLARDDAGNVYVTGQSFTAAAARDYVTVKYDPNGILQWEQRYNGTGNWDDEAVALARDGEGNVYVTGSSTGDGNQPPVADASDLDYVTIKYAQTAPAITNTKLRRDPAEQLTDPRFRVSHAPNPIVTNTRILYELPEDGHVSIVVYDALGRIVAAPVNVSQKAGSYIVDFDASSLQKGVYYYQVRVSTGKKQWVQTNKMTVMR